MEQTKWEQEDLVKRDTAKRVVIRVFYDCPQCGHSLCYSKDIRENFCPRCGQRVSWEGVDDTKFKLTEFGLEPCEEGGE